MRALVIGYGSIGQRHTRLLRGLCCDVAVLSRRELDFPSCYTDLLRALAEHRPEYVVVANPTSLHHETIEALAAAGFAGKVLVEKPLFDHSRALIDAPFRHLAVAYNLRFHPVIQRLRELVLGETVISVQAYMGQYLPDWRPASDYRQSYSASAAQGGGALRDLSHELDYLAWIFGDWQSVTALGGHLSALEIDSDDLFVLLMQMSRCPVVSVQVSYLDRTARRCIVVNTERLTIEADLIAGTISCGNELETLLVGRDFTYEAMHRAMLGDENATLCSLDEGLATLQLIDAAEQANRNREWVIR